MNRYYLFAAIALFAIAASGCTREKPATDITPPPANVTILSTPAPFPTSGAASNPSAPTLAPVAPSTGITTTTPPSPEANPPLASASVTPTIPLPPGVFSQPPPISGGSTPSAPAASVASSPTPSDVTASSSGPTNYTVQWGDWLSKIARQFGVSNEAIVAANPRMNPNLLVPGQVLNIPAPGGTNPPPSGATPTPQPGGGPTSYTVQRGDWFYAIARKFGVSVEALQTANPGVNPNFVFPGQVLNIPGAGPNPGPTFTPTPRGATATPGASPTPGGRPARYTVRPGDTLSSIAIRFSTTIYALQIANHLASPHFIYPGQILVIPK